MSKKLNIFAFIILLLGQIVLGPMGIASAEGEAPEVAPAPPTETPAPPTETPAPPTETPAPPTETPAPPAETPAPPTETPAPPTEAPSNSTQPPGQADSPNGENPWGGTVTVTKTDPTGKPVKDVKFHLTGPGNSGQYDETVETNENGVAFFDNVHHGKMTLTEIVPKGSTLCSENERTFVIADDSSGKKHHTFTYVNAPSGMDCDGNVDPRSNGPTLGVKKIFEGSKNDDLEAEFKLTSDKKYSKTGVEIDNGETKYFKDLPDGKYTLTETETEDDEGYVLIAAQKFEVKNGEIINGSLDSFNAQTKIVTIINKKKVKPVKPVKVGIVKTFEGGKTDKLKATFTLACDDYTQSQTTDKYGKATFTNVPANSDCKLTETSPPTGYQAVAPQSFKTGTKDQTLPTIKNNKKAKPVKVGIVKTFEGGKTDKLKATFTLACDDYTQSQTTDKYGKATFTDVPPNSDCELTETNTPTGYQAVAPQSFKTGTKDQALDKIMNKKIPKAQLHVTKKYENLETTNSKATFNLTGPNGYAAEIGVEIGTGGYWFMGLIPGTYTLTETASGSDDHDTAPTQTFVVDDNGYITGTIGATLFGGGHHPPQGSSKLLIDVLNPEIPKTPKGKIIINKDFEGLEGNTDLPGAEFKLYDGERWFGPVTTNSEGYAEFEELPYGSNYTLYETDAPTGFAIHPGYKDGESVTIDKAENVVTLTNPQSVDGKVIVKKIDSKYKAPLPGATFTLTSLGDSNIVFEETTNLLGRAYFEGLPHGEYQLTETKAPNGYVQTGLYMGTVTIGGSEPIVAEVTVENIKQSAVVLTKYEEDEHGPTDITLEGAVFDLYMKNPFKNEYTKVQSNLETDEDGQIIIDYLLWGDYKFVETQAPTDHEIGETTEYPFKIKRILGEIVTVSAYNALIPDSEPTGKITINKSFAELEAPFEVEAGVFATFELQDGEGNTLYGPKKTDDNGEIVFEGLSYDTTYWVVETHAPEGYDIHPEYASPGKDIHIDEENNDEKLDIINNKSGTETPTGKITINKSFAELEAPFDVEAGEFATFELQDEEGNTLFGPKNTNDNGEIVFEGLSYDTTYWVVETHASEGYDIHPEYASPGKDIHIDEENNDVKLGIMNNKTETPGGNPDPTGSITLYKHSSLSEGTPLNGVTFSIRRQSDNSVVREGLLTGGTMLGNGYLKVDGLPDGDYYFVETATIAGYNLNSTHYEFSIPYVVNDIVVDAIQEVRVPNTPTTPITPPTTPTGGGGGGGGGGPIILVPDPSPETPGDGDGEVIDPDPLPEEPGDGDGEIIDPDPLPEEPGDGDGEVIDPDPLPETPVDGDGEVIDPDPQPEAPGSTPQTEKPIKVVEQPRAKAPSKAAKVLPRTGESLAYDLLIVGLLAMLLGGWLLFGRRKRKLSKQ